MKFRIEYDITSCRECPLSIKSDGWCTPLAKVTKGSGFVGGVWGSVIHSQCPIMNGPRNLVAGDTNWPKMQENTDEMSDERRTEATQQSCTCD